MSFIERITRGKGDNKFAVLFDKCYEAAKDARKARLKLISDEPGAVWSEAQHRFYHDEDACIKELVLHELGSQKTSNPFFRARISVYGMKLADMLQEQAGNEPLRHRGSMSNDIFGEMWRAIKTAKSSKKGIE